MNIDVSADEETSFDRIIDEQSDDDSCLINQEVENNLISQYICPLTHQLIREPARLPCKHLFELTAIEQYLKEKKKCCPSCKEKTNLNDVQKEVKLSQHLILIEKLIKKRGKYNPLRKGYVETEDHLQTLNKYSEKMRQSSTTVEIEKSQSQSETLTQFWKFANSNNEKSDRISIKQVHSSIEANNMQGRRSIQESFVNSLMIRYSD